MATLVWEPRNGASYQPPSTGPAGGSDYSLRNSCTTFAAGQGQIRVTVENLADSTNMRIDNLSIGNAATPPDITGPFDTSPTTSSTFVELKFGGISGATLVQNVPQTSDWANFNSFTSGTVLITVCDMGSSTSQNSSNPITNGQSYYNATTNSYNVTSGAGFSSNPSISFMVVSIETQAGAAVATLMGAMCQ